MWLILNKEKGLCRDLGVLVFVVLVFFYCLTGGRFGQDVLV